MFRKSHISTGGERQFPVAYALINSNLQHPHPPPPLLLLPLRGIDRVPFPGVENLIRDGEIEPDFSFGGLEVSN